jgi:hypothetical protein
MPQLPCRHTVDDKGRQAGCQSQPDSQRVKGAAAVLVSLVLHQEIEPASQTGDQGQH